MTTLSLVDKRKEVDQEMIAHLEEALTLAREGKMRDLILAYTMNDLTFFTISSFTNYVIAVGLAELLKQDIVETGDRGEAE